MKGSFKDVQAIRNIVANYCQGCDDKDMDLVMSLWTDDARVVWEYVGWDLQGKDEIGKSFAGSLDAWTDTRHIHYNEKIEVQGDTATATHFGDWHGVDSEGTTWFVEGRYYREFAKEADIWKIKYQQITQKPLRLMNPLEAIQEIKNVVADYCKGYDTKDIGLCMSTFTDDAHSYWELAGHDLHGKEEIRKAFLDGMAAWSNSRHRIYNFHVKVDGNTAISEHSVDWHADDKEGTTYALEGRYYRELVKEKGSWRIKYQKTTQDFMAPFQARPRTER